MYESVRERVREIESEGRDDCIFMTGHRYVIHLVKALPFLSAHYLVVGLETREREPIIVDAPLVGKRFARRRVLHDPRLLARCQVKGPRLFRLFPTHGLLRDLLREKLLLLLLLLRRPSHFHFVAAEMIASS